MTQAPEVEVGPPSETKRLAVFIEALRQLLLDVMERPELLEPYAESFRASWPPNDARLNAIIKALSAQQPAGNLQDHGLTGDELTLKLDLFYDTRAEFDRALKRLRWHPLRWIFGHPMPKEFDVDRSGAFVPRTAKKALKAPKQAYASLRRISGKTVRKIGVKALSVGDTVLESVGAAVPEAAVAAAGAGEFKKLMENVVEAARGRRRTSAQVDATLSEEPGPEEEELARS